MQTTSPSLQYFSEWWKQLAGESEGRPKGSTQLRLYSTDLRSLGHLSEGTRIGTETVVRVDKPRKNVIIPTLEKTLTDSYLQGKI